MLPREQWKRLKRSDPELMSTLKPFVKTKWCDIAYFLAQVRALRTVVGIESSEDEAETLCLHARGSKVVRLGTGGV